MIVDCVSDLHGSYPDLLGGDLLILAGDYTAQDKITEWARFFAWLKKQNYKKKILIGGNHDGFMFTGLPKNQKQADDLQEIREFLIENDEGFEIPDHEYLCDSGTEFENLRIWGSPWTLTFEGMNPKCKFFTKDTENELNSHFELIPKNVDILITHSPPFTVMDKTRDGFQVGSTTLMSHHLVRYGFRPRLWVFGHIHEGYGQEGPYQWNNTRYVNASHMNANYRPVNKPIRIEL